MCHGVKYEFWFPPLTLIVPLQFPTVLNRPIPVPLTSMEAPSPLLLSSSSNKSWCHPELQEWTGPNQAELGQISSEPISLKLWWWTAQELDFLWVTFLIWNLFLCAYCMKKQELHSEALLSEKSFCIRYSFACSLHLCSGFSSFQDVKASQFLFMQRNWLEVGFSSHFKSHLIPLGLNISDTDWLWFH